MDRAPRHQCLIYEGAPSRHLPSLAAAAREKLVQNHRCLYLNSRPMVVGMQSYLAAAGVDVAHEIARGSLILTSEQQHLVDGRFDVDRMMESLADALAGALRDGYAGLWASGDMTWEMGQDHNFSKLVEYEQLLEEFFQDHPAMSGVCQYHINTLPPEAVRQGLLAHPTLFISETLSLINPHHVPFESTLQTPRNSELDAVILRLCHADGME